MVGFVVRVFGVLEGAISEVSFYCGGLLCGKHLRRQPRNFGRDVADRWGWLVMRYFGTLEFGKLVLGGTVRLVSNKNGVDGVRWACILFLTLFFSGGLSRGLFSGCSW